MSINAHEIHIATAFDHALAGANARDGAQQALVPLHEIALGETFIRDTAPHQLLVRAVGVALVEDDELPVVVIGCQRFDQGESIGRVFALKTRHTVRRVEVTRPLQVRARG
jgi:hypothetical protein